MSPDQHRRKPQARAWKPHQHKARLHPVSTCVRAWCPVPLQQCAVLLAGRRCSSGRWAECWGNLCQELTA
eukprot:1820284-Amphidinium_carterae.1